MKTKARIPVEPPNDSRCPIHPLVIMEGRYCAVCEIEHEIELETMGHFVMREEQSA